MRPEAQLGCSSCVIKLADLTTSTGKVHQNTRIYDGGYLMRTPSSGLQKSTKGADSEKRLGNICGYTGGNFAYQVFHTDGLSPTLLNMGNGWGRMPHIVVSYEDRTST